MPITQQDSRQNQYEREDTGQENNGTKQVYDGECGNVLCEQENWKYRGQKYWCERKLEWI